MNVRAASVWCFRRQVHYFGGKSLQADERTTAYCFAAFAVERPEPSLQSREPVARQNKVSNLGPVQFSKT